MYNVTMILVALLLNSWRADFNACLRLEIHSPVFDLFLTTLEVFPN